MFADDIDSEDPYTDSYYDDDDDQQHMTDVDETGKTSPDKISKKSLTSRPDFASIVEKTADLNSRAMTLPILKESK